MLFNRKSIALVGYAENSYCLSCTNVCCCCQAYHHWHALTYFHYKSYLYSLFDHFRKMLILIILRSYIYCRLKLLAFLWNTMSYDGTEGNENEKIVIIQRYRRSRAQLILLFWCDSCTTLFMRKLKTKSYKINQQQISSIICSNRFLFQIQNYTQ